LYFCDENSGIELQVTGAAYSRLKGMLKLNFERKGLLFKSNLYWDTKDPCPVFDGRMWHIFGSGGRSGDEIWHILHAVAPKPEGPWIEQEASILEVVQGPHVAAPGVIYDAETNLFHMFIQREFMQLGGTIEHLVSADGNRFRFSDTSLTSLPLPNSMEAGIYDPHPALIKGKKYFVYSGMERVTRPDLCVAESESGTWEGPWKRLGTIVAHEDIFHHNQHTHEDYEWGLEGSQLIELPSGNILLNAVCFLPEGRRGERQRVFFAAAKDVKGPYHTMGPIIEPFGEKDQEENWESGENGHAAAVIHGEFLYLYYQSRAFSARSRWCYGLAVFKVDEIEKIVAETLARPPQRVDRTTTLTS
jgi:hypothetical protein